MAATTLKLNKKSWNAAGKQGDEEIFSRLIEQAHKSHSTLPATSYKEAIDCIHWITSFPRFLPGPEASEATREHLAPLLIDLIHLAYGYADREAGDDPISDIMSEPRTAS